MPCRRAARSQLGITLALFVVVYFVVFGAGTAYLLRLIAKGPVGGEGLRPGPAGRAGRAADAAAVGGSRCGPPRDPGAELMGIDLPLMWAVIILFGVMMYVVMDGFDLGIGMLFPFFAGKGRPRRDDEHRRAGVGRQRDLARARRRGTARRVSARLFGGAERVLPAARS